jgi:Ca2+-binding EF-hand superfamily protein
VCTLHCIIIHVLYDREFLDNFDVGGVKDGVVTKEEFYNYYRAISCSIQRDDYFELMIRNAWHISGGEGAAANSANRRVLVTRADGTQFVQEVTNDLGVRGGDKAGLAARLKAQGVEAANIDLYGAGEDNSKTAPSTGKSSKRGHKKGATASASAAAKPKVPVEPPPGIKMIISRIKEEMKSRGSGGFVGLQRRFRIMDDDGSKSLSLAEFKKALSEFKMNLTEPDLRAVFSFFDTDNSGAIDFEEFVQGVREPLNPRRLKLVEQAFTVIDRDGSGIVDAQEVASMYDASKHPEVIARRKTVTQVLTEFLDTFDVGGVKDGMVTRQEFVNYYSNIGASIDNDDYFELMIRNAWHLSGGVGASANTTNMKVLITDSNGVQSTVEVQNDLGLKKDDLPGIYSRLKAQGVRDIRSINGRAVNFGSGADGKETLTVGGAVAALNTNDFKAPNVQRARPVSHGATGTDRGQSRTTAGPSGAPPAPASALPQSMSTNQFAAQRAGLAGRVMSQMQRQHAKEAREAEQAIVGNTLLDVLRVQLLSRGAAGIIELQRRFADMDADGSHSLDYAEFRQALLTNKLKFSEDQLKALFSYFGKYMMSSLVPQVLIVKSI